MTQPPLVSIGMPVFNGETYLEKALDTLLAQSYGNFELIISDNASTDRTEAICKQYASKDARIKYVRNGVNVGACRNFSQLVHYATGKYFMWAAYDDLWEKDFIKLCLEVLEQHPNAVMCTSNFSLIDEDGLHVDNRSPYETTQLSFKDRIIKFFTFEWISYGLYRLDLLKKTHLFQEIPGPDTVLGLEIHFLGDIVKVHQNLFSYRLKKNPNYIDLISTDPAIRTQLSYRPGSQLMHHLYKVLATASIDTVLKQEIINQFIDMMTRVSNFFFFALLQENSIVFFNEIVDSIFLKYSMVEIVQGKSNFDEMKRTLLSKPEMPKNKLVYQSRSRQIWVFGNSTEISTVQYYLNLAGIQATGIDESKEKFIIPFLLRTRPVILLTQEKYELIKNQLASMKYRQNLDYFIADPKFPFPCLFLN